MLDIFLKTAAEYEARADADNELVALMRGLPVEELSKIAATGKVACGMDTDPAYSTFLQKFQGTPLYDKALAIEQEALQQDIADQQRQRARSMQDSARDGLRIKRRLLELELAKQQSGAAPPLPVEEASPQPIPMEAKAAAAFMGALNGLRSMAAPALKTVGGLARANPVATAGAALGAGAGLVHGMSGRDGGVGKGLTEGLVGGALGGGAGMLGQRALTQRIPALPPRTAGLLPPRGM